MGNVLQETKIEAMDTGRRLVWIAVALIAWNTFDVIAHVVNGFVIVGFVALSNVLFSS